jgi:hypothetical protein
MSLHVCPFFVYRLKNYEFACLSILCWPANISYTFIDRQSSTTWYHVKLLITNSSKYTFLTDGWAVSGTDNHLIVIRSMLCLLILLSFVEMFTLHFLAFGAMAANATFLPAFSVCLLLLLCTATDWYGALSYYDLQANGWTSRTKEMAADLKLTVIKH